MTEYRRREAAMRPETNAPHAEKERSPMQYHLSPSWKLSTEHAASSYGIPVLVNCQTGEAFGPGDIVKAYPSHGFAPATDVVRRLAKTAHRDEEGARLISRFLAQRQEGPPV